MQQQRLADLRADGHHRIERAHRLLEDHRDVAAADVRHALRAAATADRCRRSGCARCTVALSGSSRRIDSEVTDLPEPDSPTMPTLSPAATVKLTSSTTRTDADARVAPGRRRTGPRPRARLALIASFRVEHVAHGIADEIEGQHDDGDRRTGRDHGPGRTEQVVQAVADDVAPARMRRPACRGRGSSATPRGGWPRPSTASSAPRWARRCWARCGAG